MPDTVENPAHYARWKSLAGIARSVRHAGVDEFDLQQLETFNIRVESMVLSDVSPLKPSYFAPYPRHSIVKPEYGEHMAGCYNGVDDETEPYFTQPADRAYVMSKYLLSYISRTKSRQREKGMWTSKW